MPFVASFLFLWIAAVLPSRAADAAAEVIALRGDVLAQAPGESPRILKAGGQVYPSDRVSTGPGAAVRLSFTDQTSMTLGAHTELRIESYSAQAGSLRFIAAIGKGVFRVVTGMIARAQPGAVRFDTPAAVIGIRGTHFGGETDGSSATIVLLDPTQGEHAGAIEVYNQYGRVAIDEPGYGTEVPDASSPPSPPRRMRLRSVENLLRALSGIQRMPGPARSVR